MENQSISRVLHVWKSLSMIGLSGPCAASMNHSRRCRNVSSEAREVGKASLIMRRSTRLVGNSPGRHEAREFS